MTICIGICMGVGIETEIKKGTERDWNEDSDQNLNGSSDLNGEWDRD